MRKRYRVALAALAAAGVFAAGYANGVAQTAMDNGSAERRVKQLENSERFGEDLEISDEDLYETIHEFTSGRKLHVRLMSGTGVEERHTTEGSATWSEWQTVYRTKADLCGDATLAESKAGSEGTVSLIADFGPHCGESERPGESLAIVSTGDLTDWDVDVQKDADGCGWNAAVPAGRGGIVFVCDNDGLYSLRWDKGKGFSEVDAIHSPDTH